MSKPVTTNQREIPDLPNGWQLASLYQIDDNWYCDLQNSWTKESSVGDSPRGAVDYARKMMPPQTAINWGALYKLRDHLAKKNLIAELNTLNDWLYENDLRRTGDNIDTIDPHMVKIIKAIRAIGNS